MSIYQARLSAKKAMINGNKHHVLDFEQENLLRFFHGENILPKTGITIETYEDVLAPERFRSQKNSVICFITVASRTAIASGLNSEYAFALSDYYVNQVELTSTTKKLEDLVFELLQNYRELIQIALKGNYSPIVAKTVQYIHQNIYETCKVSNIAKSIGIHPSYLSSVFKNELGETLSHYISRAKINEAKVLLSQMHFSITQTAETLGYSSTAHFSTAFKSQTNQTPSAFIKTIK